MDDEASTVASKNFMTEKEENDQNIAEKVKNFFAQCEDISLDEIDSDCDGSASSSDSEDYQNET